LVEAAWLHRRPLRTANTAVRIRRQSASPAVRARGEAADTRLHQRWIAFQARGKTTNIAAVAVARELAGWCWSLAVMTE
ncbi:MAG TPA: IS110 family transposase, partial [Micromonosporaceae bacterium]